MGRGKGLGTPTVNLASKDVPPGLDEGVYAVFVWIDEGGERFSGALHYGARPVFGDPPACEVHVLDTVLEKTPRGVEIEVVERLRDVEYFPSVEALKEAIARDIARARAILSA
jgi:riboflavin kinase/FMN adenylyltransferase